MRTETKTENAKNTKTETTKKKKIETMNTNIRDGDMIVTNECIFMLRIASFLLLTHLRGGAGGVVVAAAADYCCCC